MRILKHRLYGSWDYEESFLFLKEDGTCTVVMSIHKDSESGKLNRGGEHNGTYEVINNKLILKYGDNKEFRWIAEIIYVYQYEMKLLDLNGSNVGEIEIYRKRGFINPEEEEWYYKFVGVPKHKLLDAIYDFVFYNILKSITIASLVLSCVLPILVLLYFVFAWLYEVVFQ